MKVIAISGWKRSGKDTVAQYLIDNRNFSRVAFADPLKDRVAEEYDVPRDHCDNPEFKEAPILHMPVLPKDKFTLELSKMMYKEFRTAGGIPALDFYVDPSGAFLGVMGRHVEQLYWTPRALCILKGSVNRAVKSDYWVKAAINNIKDFQKNAPFKSCNTDEIKLNGNVIISDLRYKSEVDQLRQAFGKNLVTVRVNRFDTCQSDDPSERDLDNCKFDVILDNKGTLEELFNKVNEVIK